MSNRVRIRFKSYLPGQGHDANGSPKAGKQHVIGVATVTSYSPGESLTPSDMNLETLDHVEMVVTEATSGTAGPRTAHYSYSAQEFYILENNDDINTKGNNYVVSFSAFGDSADGVELR